MRTLNNHALLGLFVAIGLGLFILAVLTVGSRQKTFSKTARVRIVFDDAGGLQAGCNVWLSGVKIGTVRRLTLDASTTDTTLFRQLQTTLADLRAASHKISDAAGNINLGSRALSDPNTPAGALLTDPTVAADLKATVSHLRTSSEKLDEDLLALQHNFLLRGFFRKKEKARKDSLKALHSF